MHLFRIVICLFILTCSGLTKSFDKPKEDECPLYGFSFNEFFEELSAGSEMPIAPIGRFVMLKEGEEYFLDKIPKPVKVMNYKTNKEEVLPITKDYCWYTSISGISAIKDGYMHSFELSNDEWKYVETSEFITLISSD